MSKKIGIMLLVATLCCTNAVSVIAETIVYDGRAHEYNLSPISLYVNGEKISTTMNPIQLDGRVLVPAREVFTPMGATVGWDAKAKQVTVTYKGTTMILTVNQKVVLLNGKKVELDVPAKIINDKVMIPVRFISEQLGFKVDWNGSKRTVSITEPTSTGQKPSVEEVPSVSSQEYIGTSNQHQIQISSMQYAETKIMEVSVNEVNNQHTTVISATNPISNVKVQIQAGKVIVDIGNSKSQLSSTITPISNTFIKSIRTSQFTSDTTRVVLDLKAGALVKATLNEDRTRIELELTNQKIEQIKYTTSGETEKLSFKGLSKDQIHLNYIEDKQKLEFLIPHATMELDVIWSQLKGKCAQEIRIANEGNQVKGTILLRNKISYELANDYVEATLTLCGETGTPPAEETPETMVYKTQNKPTIELSNLLGLSKNSVKVTDEYRDKKLTFDLGKDYSHLIKDSTMPINDNNVSKIQVTTNGTTKIIVFTQKVFTYNVYESQNKISLELVKPKEKYNQIIVLDPGHGGSDSGAVGNNLAEKTINYKQAMALYKLLEADSNIKVYMTRETDVYPTLAFRTTLANDIEADLFVSIHNNSASASIRGAETLYYPSTTDMRGKQVAQLIQNALVNKCGMQNRGIKARSDLYVLRNSNMPAVLIETGFISNASDAALLNSSSFTTKWAEAIYQSIVSAFKVL